MAQIGAEPRAILRSRASNFSPFRELASELADLTPPGATDPGVPAHGVLAETERASIRRAVLREVVVPCAEAVLAAASASGAERQPPTALSAWSA
jgi:hypothetical protein